LKTLPPEILVLGGTGFVGQSVCHRLVAAGYRVLVPTRRRKRAQPLLVLPTVDIAIANIHDRDELVRLMQGKHAVINLVGVLHDSPRGEFDRVHVELPKKVISAARAANVRRLVHMSALGASDVGPSSYLKSRGRGEMVAQTAMEDRAVTVFRPSVIFGPGDSFTRLFDRLSRLLPVMMLAGAEAKFQPVDVEDVARAVVESVDAAMTYGQTYELGGPDVFTLREIVTHVMAANGAKRPIIGLQGALAELQALMLEYAPGGPIMTRDNLASMRVDNIAGPWPRVFGWKPAAMPVRLKEYLANQTSRARYQDYRAGAGR
jgi:uncharacterized protein YbjT (DUF2867 family)